MTAQDCPNASSTGAAKTDLFDAHRNRDSDSESNRDLLCFEVLEEMKGSSTSPRYGHINEIKEGMPHSSLLTLPFQMPVRIRNSMGQLKPDCAEDLPVPVPGPVMGGISILSSSSIISSSSKSNSNSNSISSNSNISITNSSSSSDNAIDSIRQSEGDVSRRTHHSASIYPVGSAMQFARTKQ